MSNSHSGIKKRILSGLLIIAALGIVNMQSCKSLQLTTTENNIRMLPEISEYHIFKGPATDLQPAGDFKLYELAASLFTDYAEKQRLVKVPPSFKISVINNELSDFPDGTILVKTFYYFNDKRNLSGGKKLIKTRLLIKANSKWNAGTYQWNKEQTEAFLISGGADMPVSWIDENSLTKTINYHIPGNRECASCHNSDNVLIPIGFKIRNLNINIIRDNAVLNQVAYLQARGVLNNIDPLSFSSIPDWRNKSLPVEERTRAYLDINCAHCHSEKGYCSNSKLRLDFEIPFHNTYIAENTKRIDKYMTRKKMPLLGTTIVDAEGLSLIKEYIKSLK